MASRLRRALATRVGVDPRALAAFRIAVGALILVDLLLRARSLRAFYTDAGVLPRPALREAFPLFSRLSIHALSGAAWVQVALFCLAGAAALALLVGYRTRLALLISWVLLVSLQARNPFVLNGGDVLLRRVTFWALFLPLGARWAVDADRRAADRVVGVASAAVLLQVVVVYPVNAVLKLQGEEWLAGEAVRYVFSLDQFTTPLGAALTGAPTLLRVAAWGWLALVCASPLLVLATGRARAALAALFVGAHLGMFATMHLGLFPLVAVAALLPFFPPFVWDAVERRVAPLASALPPVSSPRRLALPASVERWRGPAARTVVAVLLVLVLVWDAPGLSAAVVGDGPPAPASERWDMFAPEPLSVDGWYVVPGTLASGERVDAFRGGPVSWDRPPNLASTYPSDRWRKYLANVYRGDARAADFARALCRRAPDLASVEVVYVAEPTRLGAPEPTRRENLSRVRCR